MENGWVYIKSVIGRHGLGLHLLVLVAIALLAAALEGVGIGLLLPVIETLQQTEKPAKAAGFSGLIKGAFDHLHLPWTLATLLAVTVGIFILQVSLVYLRVVLAAVAQNRLVADLRSRAFINLMDFDLAFFHRARIGEVVSALITDAYRAGYAFRSMVETCAGLCVLIMYGLLALMVSWQMTLVAFPLIGMLAFLLRPRRSYELGLDYSKENDRLQVAAMESLGGIREIQSLGIGGVIGDRFRQAAETVGRLDFSLLERGSRFTFVYQCIVFALIAGLVYFASESAGLSLSTLLVFLVLLQRLSPRVSAFTEQRHVWLGYAGSMEKAERLLAETARARASVQSGPVPFSRLERGIELKGLHFRHSGHDSDILAGVTLVIPRRQTLAIVGPSGSGKSTLLDLLVRFYDPSTGRILVDDHDLRELDLSSWRQGIGLVSQETFLFHDTIENNIRYGDLTVSTGEIVRAAEQAYAHRFIQALPEGYQTIVGDRGSRISGGQRQRLALARAILRKPQILILDEATSDLDVESEVYIQRAIQEISAVCTVIMVAHKLSTIEHADQICVLEQGTIRETGKHHELLARGGRYAQLYQSQFKAKAVLHGA